MFGVKSTAKASGQAATTLLRLCPGARVHTKIGR
jgi:hypothetical protein